MNGPTVAVVGAGITGLAAAHRLGELARARELPLTVHAFEQHASAGGNIRTERRDELLLEWGPDQIVRHKPAGLELCRRLGLEDELELLDAAGAVPQVVRHGRPVRLPAGLGLMGPSRIWPLVSSPLFSWPGLVRLACEPLVGQRPDGVDDESNVVPDDDIRRETIDINDGSFSLSHSFSPKWSRTLSRETNCKSGRPSKCPATATMSPMR